MIRRCVVALAKKTKAVKATVAQKVAPPVKKSAASAATVVAKRSVTPPKKGSTKRAQSPVVVANKSRSATPVTKKKVAATVVIEQKASKVASSRGASPKKKTSPSTVKASKKIFAGTDIVKPVKPIVLEVVPTPIVAAPVKKAVQAAEAPKKSSPKRRSLDATITQIEEVEMSNMIAAPTPEAVQAEVKKAAAKKEKSKKVAPVAPTISSTPETTIVSATLTPAVKQPEVAVAAATSINEEPQTSVETTTASATTVDALEEAAAAAEAPIPATFNATLEKLGGSLLMEVIAELEGKTPAPAVTTTAADTAPEIESTTDLNNEFVTENDSSASSSTSSFSSATSTSVSTSSPHGGDAQAPATDSEFAGTGVSAINGFCDAPASASSNFSTVKAVNTTPDVVFTQSFSTSSLQQQSAALSAAGAKVVMEAVLPSHLKPKSYVHSGPSTNHSMTPVSSVAEATKPANVVASSFDAFFI